MHKGIVYRQQKIQNVLKKKESKIIHKRKINSWEKITQADSLFIFLMISIKTIFVWICSVWSRARRKFVSDQV